MTMRVIYESTFEGWLNFGTIDQSYEIPYTIQVGKTGKVYKVSDKSRKLIKSHACPWLAITEKEYREVYLYE